MALTKVTKELIQGGLGVDWQATVKTGNFQAVASQGYFVNTTSNQVIVTMPPTASVGDIVSIVDYAGTAQTNNIKITAQSNINGSANDVKIDYQRGAVSIIYSGTIQGWVAEFAANDGTDALVNSPSTIAVDYLVVAGGGSGGGSKGGNATVGSGGGGAGGYKAANSYSIYTGTDYNITIGPGGSSNANAAGDNGSNSTFNLITATGGDGGGSSGGDSGDSPTNTGGTNYTSGAYWGAGGGAGTGSNQNGSNGSSGSGGNGGNGYQSSITGTATNYGGGGGGGIYQNTGGSGGSGGGGNGLGTVSNGNAGTANTGGGGGGAGSAGGSGSSDYSGGAGGSGVVILRYLTTSVASFIVTGTLNTPTPIIDGTYSVLRFTTGTGTITFS